MDSHFAWHFRIARLELDTNLGVDALADIIEGGCIVRFDGKAMRMDHGQHSVCMWREKLFLAVIQAFKVVKEFEGGSRQIHDIMRNGRGHGNANWLGPL